MKRPKYRTSYECILYILNKTNSATQIWLHRLSIAAEYLHDGTLQYELKFIRHAHNNNISISTSSITFSESDSEGPVKNMETLFEDSGNTS